MMWGSAQLTIALFLVLLLLLAEMYRMLGKHLDVQTDEEEIDSGSVLGARFVRSYIVTHTDFDGMASGALLLRHLGSDAGLLFSSPRQLHTTLVKATQGLTAHDSIYIADLAMPPEHEQKFLEIFDQIRTRQIRLHWIDHHQWPAGLQERTAATCETFEIDTSVGTAAELVRRLLPGDDDTAEKILRFVQNRSRSEDADWDKTWRMLLSEVVNRRDPDLSEKVLQAWAEGKGMGMMEAYLAKQGMKREELTRKIAGFKHRSIVTDQNRTFLVIDVRSRRLERAPDNKLLYVMNAPKPSVMVGSLACRESNADFCVIVWEDFRFSVYRGEDRALDFSGLFPEVRTETAQYTVAGHGYACSVRANPGFWSRIRSLFQFRLPQEAETFFTVLRERF